MPDTKTNFKPEPSLFKKEVWPYIIISAVAYFCAIESCFIIFQFVKGLELRPATCLATVAGMMWGMPGAIGIALGNAAVVMKNGVGFTDVLLSSVANFFLSYLPYRMWYAIDNQHAFHFIYDKRTLRKILLILGTAGTVAAMQICTFAHVLYGLSLRHFSVYVWAAQVIFPVAIAIPVIFFLRRRHVTCYYPHKADGFFNLSFCAPVVYGYVTASAVYLYGNGKGYFNFIEPYFFYPVSFLVAIYLANLACDYQPDENDILSDSFAATITCNFFLLGIVYSCYDCYKIGYRMIEGFAGYDDELFWIWLMQEFFTNLLVVFMAVYLMLRFLEKHFFARLDILSRLTESFVRTGQIDEESRELNEIIDTERNDEIDKFALAYRKLGHDIREYIKDLSSMIKEKENLSAQMEIATNIQMHALPDIEQVNSRIEGYTVAGGMKPAKEVGGDMNVCLLQDDDHMVIGIGDVSGKGISAALCMMAANTLTCAYIRDNEKADPAEILTKVNEGLAARNEDMMFITMWLGVLELSTGKLIYANGGHNFPLLADGENTAWLDGPSGPPVGIMPFIELTNNEITISPGSKLFIYTDGITEAENEAEELYGDDRLQAILPQVNSPEELLDDVHSFVGDAEQSDDMTYMWLSRN